MNANCGTQTASASAFTAVAHRRRRPVAAVIVRVRPLCTHNERVGLKERESILICDGDYKRPDTASVLSKCSVLAFAHKRQYGSQSRSRVVACALGSERMLVQLVS